MICKIFGIYSKNDYHFSYFKTIATLYLHIKLKLHRPNPPYAIKQKAQIVFRVRPIEENWIFYYIRFSPFLNRGQFQNEQIKYTRLPFISRRGRSEMSFKHLSIERFVSWNMTAFHKPIFCKRKVLLCTSPSFLKKKMLKKVI